MRVAVIDKEKCKPEKCGTPCIKYCPRVRSGITDTIKIGEETKKAEIDENLCIGCGICPKKCPYKTITIINLPEEKENPIHQYGLNSFRLFSLPKKIEGVTGLLGPNGIGKTTIVNILSGQIIPNFKRNASLDEVIEFYRKTELGNHFEKIRDKGVKFSIKPQKITYLPKLFPGKLRELLEKSGEREKMEELIEKLSISHLLERDVKDLSGGELQRTAIAISSSKDADFYFFDEPSSYLDIKQRLIAGKVIRGLEKKILVVEHDLVMLDYLTDTIHLLFGSPGAYGIVSNPLATRVGINSYLDGFLREENIRFGKPIRFEKKERTKLEGAPIVSFSDMKVDLGGFSLKVPGGEIIRGEIIGIIGENGIGKTTFVKVLAGEIDATGELSRKIKVSYKPQYLKAEDTTLREIARECKKTCKDINFEEEILRPLGLMDLLDEYANTLSGGELQRLAVAICLSKEADLYLFDEPATYLDSMQRQIVAKTIRRISEKRKKSSLVVDHDLMFIDYLSDRLMVFLGEPGIEGEAFGPMLMHEGMNKFLESIGLTFRRDPDSGRPRANKEGSRLDKEQKSKGEYYYFGV